ncbi:OsmC family protein [Nitratireductor luteus]|uniref:OsmC family protein n=1 Tax=Nitratireductor luteus TaxID=2976980 RepID=UPI0022406854|nr:OsmC family protein [Nitratireductor luteus]
MTEVNGWTVEHISEAVEGVRQQPEAGVLTWRSRVAWDGAFGLDVRTLDIEQLGQRMPRHFTMRGDHPPELLGQNTGPTAVETLLAALGACMTGTFAAQATVRGVALSRLEVDVQAEMDLNGFFGLKPVSPAVSDVKLVYRVESDASPETLSDILDATKALSPVFNTVTRPVAVEAAFANAAPKVQ